MSTPEAASPSGEKTGVWSEEEKIELFYRIFLHFKDGKAINWKQINMPGRNSKSMTNVWTKINKPITELEKRLAACPDAGTQSVTPKKASPAKRKAKDMDGDAAEEDDTASTPSKKPGKRKPRTPKKVKAEVSDKGSISVKNEPDGDGYPSDCKF
ncbi:hypothetical protein K4F52_009425 [Lecanicillium sp. MT-2017a]|nr:hypothetical protein K4F52_009425 [Lecanicillium sp. MT-2017a]